MLTEKTDSLVQSNLSPIEYWRLHVLSHNSVVFFKQFGINESTKPQKGPLSIFIPAYNCSSVSRLVGEQGSMYILQC